MNFMAKNTTVGNLDKEFKPQEFSIVSIDISKGLKFIEI